MSKWDTSSQNHKLFWSETRFFVVSDNVIVSCSNGFVPLHLVLPISNYSICLHKIINQVFINLFRVWQSQTFLSFSSWILWVFCRVVKMPEVETETNPVDRTVAHLLFHRPMDIPGKHPNTPESPFSTKLPCEHKTMGLAKLSTGSLSETPKGKPNFSQKGSQLSSLLTNAQPVCNVLN
jgi:hypothetical protein